MHHLAVTHVQRRVVDVAEIRADLSPLDPGVRALRVLLREEQDVTGAYCWLNHRSPWA